MEHQAPMAEPGGVAGLWEDTSRLGQVAFALLTDLFLVMKVVGRFLSHWEVAVGWGQPVFTYPPSRVICI